METQNSDINYRKHKGQAQSVAANKRVDKQGDRNFIIEYLQAHGTGYSKQIARVMDKGLNAVSGRFSALLADGIIERTGEVIEGCAVYRLVK